MAQETSEYLIRQQSKVKTPKSLVKVVRAHTRELKRQRKGEDTKALAGIVQELIRAGGGTAAGFASGTITGPILLILGLAYAGQLGLLDPIYDIASRIAKAIGDGFKTGAVTDFTKNTLDALAPDITVVSGGTGPFCFSIVPAVPFIPGFFQPAGEVCFAAAQSRDSALKLVKDKLGALAVLYTFKSYQK